MFQLWPLELFQLIPVSLEHIPSFCVCVFMYLFTYLPGRGRGSSPLGTIRCSRLMCIFLALVLDLPFLQGALVPFVRECYQKPVSAWDMCSAHGYRGNFKHCNLNNFIHIFCTSVFSYSVSYSAMTIMSLTKASLSELPPQMWHSYQRHSPIFKVSDTPMSAYGAKGCWASITGCAEIHLCSV